MRKTISGLLIFSVFALLAYHTVVFITPYVILLKVKLSSHSEFNQPIYAGIITDKDRQVVLPNPDFIYVASGYDIRKAPIRITGTMPDSTYCSIALYASSTLNYFIKNDRQTPGKEINILLVKQGDEARYKGEPGEIVASPSTMGTMLVRILINDTSRIGYLKEMQKTFKIEALN